MLLGACGSSPAADEDSGDSYTFTYCFVGAVRVHTPAGLRRIDALEVGDVVLGFDTHTRSVTQSRVTHVLRSRATRVGRVEVDDRVIAGVTEEHPFYDPERDRWVPAKDLEAGAPVVLLDEGETRPTTLSAVAFADVEPTEVFNITVDGVHCYFAEGILVHNKVPTETPPCTDTFDTVPIDEAEEHTGLVPADELALMLGAWQSTAEWSATELIVGATLELGVETSEINRVVSRDDEGVVCWAFLDAPVLATLTTDDGVLADTFDSIARLYGDQPPDFWSATQVDGLANRKGLAMAAVGWDLYDSIEAQLLADFADGQTPSFALKITVWNGYDGEFGQLTGDLERPDP